MQLHVCFHFKNKIQTKCVIFVVHPEKWSGKGRRRSGGRRDDTRAVVVKSGRRKRKRKKKAREDGPRQMCVWINRGKKQQTCDHVSIRMKTFYVAFGLSDYIIERTAVPFIPLNSKWTYTCVISGYYVFIYTYPSEREKWEWAREAIFNWYHLHLITDFEIHFIVGSSHLVLADYGRVVSKRTCRWRCQEIVVLLLALTVCFLVFRCLALIVAPQPKRTWTLNDLYSVYLYSFQVCLYIYQLL